MITIGMLLFSVAAAPVNGMAETAPPRSWYEHIDFSVGLGAGQLTDRTELNIDGVSRVANQTNLFSFITLGAAYPMPGVTPPLAWATSMTNASNCPRWYTCSRWA